jgi:3-oxoacyl-[acyl-carrier-protein] synthase II
MVSPVGLDTADTWEALLQGRSGVGYVTRFDTSKFPTKIAAEVKGFDPLRYLSVKEVRKMDLFIQYAISASDYAVDASGLEITPENGEEVGVFIGSGIGGFGIIEREHNNFLAKGPRRISPFFIPSTIVNLAAGQVSIRHGAMGPNSATCTACSAGSHALGDSFRMIQRGETDVMIAGGTEAAITPMGMGGFSAMRALSKRNDAPEKASRPFDLQRDGFVMGEGAGILVLEEMEQARKRGAEILAEVVGYGMSGDAHHITAPPEDGSGAARAMRKTLEDARVSPEEVDYINAHGTSTLPNDRIETLAIKTVFGDHARQLAVSATKSMTGHLLGAAGGLEGGIVVQTLKDQIIPPTINLENSDPDCDLDYVPHQARKTDIRYAMSNSFGFGGTNACLLFKRHDS